MKSMIYSSTVPGQYGPIHGFCSGIGTGGTITGIGEVLRDANPGSFPAVEPFIIMTSPSQIY